MPAPLTVTSLNLRGPADPSPHSWDERRPRIVSRLQAIRPAVLGTQEGYFAQLVGLGDALPGYTWVGEGRDGGSHGEFMAVFVDRARFDVVEYDHRWLSQTPRVPGSRSWDTACPRMLTWLRLHDRVDSRDLVVLNTHLDHHSAAARTHGAELIVATVAEVADGDPVIVTGDFNEAAGDGPAYRILTGTGLRDTWTAAPDRRGPDAGTAHEYRPDRPRGGRIDWILAGPHWTVAAARIDDTAVDGLPVSDHFPITAELRRMER